MQIIDIFAQKVYNLVVVAFLFVIIAGLTMKVAFNLFTLKRKLELQNNKSYTWEGMAQGIGIHRNTMLNIASNRTERLDLSIVAGMLVYFRSEGMPIAIQDLFTVTAEKEDNA